MGEKSSEQDPNYRISITRAEINKKLLHDGWNWPCFDIERNVPRDKLENELYEKLNDQFTRILCYGLPAFGKTQLVLHVANNREHDASNLWFRFWFDATSPEKLRNQYIKLAKYIKQTFDIGSIAVEDSIGKIISYFKTLKKCIIVYDNVTNYKEIKRFIPEDITGKIIITSREDFDDNKIEKIKVTPLSQGEATHLLTGSLETNYENLSTKQKKIIEVLERQPMALALARDYLQNESFIIGRIESATNPEVNVTALEKVANDYLTAYEKNKDSFSDYSSSAGDNLSAIKPTIIALLINVKYIKKEFPEGWSTLLRCTYLDKRNIPKKFFEANDSTTDILLPLYEYGLLADEDEDHVCMHELLQLVLKIEIKKNINILPNVLLEAGNKLVTLYMQKFGNPEIKTQEYLVTHSYVLLSEYKNIWPNLDKSKKNLLKINFAFLLAIANDISHFRIIDGKDSILYIENALPALEESYSSVLKDNSSFSPDALRISKKLQLMYMALGLAYFAEGENVKSRIYYCEALRLTEKNNNFNRAKLYGYIGQALQRSGHFMQAIQYLSLAVKTYLKHVSPEDPIIAMFYSMIGIAYYCLGNYSLALENTQEALKLKIKFYEDENHIEVAFTKSYLGSIYYGMDKLGEAKAYLTAARKVIEENTDKNLLRYIPSLVKYAQVLHYEAVSNKEKSHQYDEVIELCNDSIELYKQYQNNRPYLIFALLEISEALLSVGKYDEAFKYLHEAYTFGYEYYNEILSGFVAYQINPYIFWHENLDDFYQNSEFVKHKNTFKEILEITIKLYATNHPCTARRYYDLGMLYKLNSESNLARRYFSLAHDCLSRIKDGKKFQFAIDKVIVIVEKELLECQQMGIAKVLSDINFVERFNRLTSFSIQDSQQHVLKTTKDMPQNMMLLSETLIEINTELKAKLQNWFDSTQLFSIRYVSGQPHIGKTFFATQAVKYLRELNEKFFVGWLIAFTEENFRMSLYQLAIQLKIEGVEQSKFLATEFIVDMIFAALQSLKIEKILIVIDDVSEYDLIRSFLAKARAEVGKITFRIIITSRNDYFPIPHEENYLQLNSINKLNKLDANELNTIIHRYFKNISKDSCELIKTFVQEIDGDLFLFTQAAAFINQYCYDVKKTLVYYRLSKYIELYKTLRNNNISSVQALHVLTLLAIVKQGQTRMLMALYTLCSLDPYCISRSFFSEDILRLLINFNVLTPVCNNDYLVINRSLQVMLFELIATHKIHKIICTFEVKYIKILKDTLKVLQAELGKFDKNIQYSSVVKTIPNFVNILKKFEYLNLIDDELLQAILSLKGYCSQIERNYTKAITFMHKYLLWLFRAFRTPESISRNQQEQLLTVLNELGHFYYDSGKYLEAIIYYQEYIDIYLKDKKLDDQVMQILERIGIIWNSLGYHHRAHIYQRQALHYYSNKSFSIELNNKLGVIRYHLGEFDQAIQLMGGKTKFYKQESDSGRLIRNFTVLASSYYSKGDYDNAQRLQVQALEISYKYYGEYHPETAKIKSSLGNVLYALGKEYTYALEIQQSAYKISCLFYGERNLRNAIILGRLGKVKNALGLYNEAISDCQRAIKIFKNYYSLSHPRVILIYLILSEAQYMNSQLVKSLDNLKKAVDIGFNIYGADLPQIMGYRISQHDRKIEEKKVDNLSLDDLETTFNCYGVLLGEAHPRTKFFKEKLEFDVSFPSFPYSNRYSTYVSNSLTQNKFTQNLVTSITQHKLTQNLVTSVTKIYTSLFTRQLSIRKIITQEVNDCINTGDPIKSRKIARIFAFAISVNFKLDVSGQHGVFLFYELCRYGDLRLLKRVFQAINAEEFQKLVNKKTNQAWTPLMLAALKNYTELAKFLVENGADVNAYSELKDYEINDRNKIINRRYTCYLDTPLYWAATNRNDDLIGYLLGKKADCSRPFNDGRNILHLTLLADNFKAGLLEEKQKKIFKLLFDRIPDEVLDDLVQREFGRLARTLLHQAVEVGDATLVETLLKKYKADMFKTTSDGRLIIQTARDIKIRNLLLQHFAEFYGIELLYEVKHDNFPNNNSLTFNKSVLQYILYKLSLGNKKDTMKRINKDNINRIIRLAVSLGDMGDISLELIQDFLKNEQIVKFLEFNNKDYGDRIFYMVAFGGSVAIMQLLIENYQKKYNELPKLQFINYNTWTPLMSAAFRNNQEMFMFLMKQLLLGNDTNAEERTSDAKNEKSKRISEYINCANEEGGETALYWSVMNNNLSFVDMLLEAGADPMLPDKLGVTSLHLAARKGNAKILQSLLQKLKKIKSQSEDFQKAINLISGRFYCAPLHEAIWAGNVDAVEILLKYGASPFILAIHDRDAFDLIEELESNANDKEESNADKMFRILSNGQKPLPRSSTTNFFRRSFERPANVEKTSSPKLPHSLKSYGLSIN